VPSPPLYHYWANSKPQCACFLLLFKNVSKLHSFLKTPWHGHLLLQISETSFSLWRGRRHYGMLRVPPEVLPVLPAMPSVRLRFDGRSSGFLLPVVDEQRVLARQLWRHPLPAACVTTSAYLPADGITTAGWRQTERHFSIFSSLLHAPSPSPAFPLERREEKKRGKGTLCDFEERKREEGGERRREEGET